MFVAVWGASPASVSRASLAGAHRTRLAHVKLVYPGALAADLARRRLYWTDSYLECVETSDYDGGHRTTIRRNYVVRMTTPL